MSIELCLNPSLPAQNLYSWATKAAQPQWYTTTMMHTTTMMRHVTYLDWSVWTKCLNSDRPIGFSSCKIYSFTNRLALQHQFQSHLSNTKWRSSITCRLQHTTADLGYFMLQELAVLKDHFTVGRTHFKSPADTLFGMISLSMLWDQVRLAEHYRHSDTLRHQSHMITKISIGVSSEYKWCLLPVTMFTPTYNPQEY